MQADVIILGAGGHAKVIADIILKAGDHLVGFLDDFKTGEILGLPILGKFNDILKFSNNYSFIIGIGSNQIRKQLAEKYYVSWYTAIHPSAIIANDVIIGVGTTIMAGAIINPSTVIGNHCIINTGAVVEHDNIIANYVHISPNATLCGTVSIGEKAHIGAGATIKNNTSICNDCIIGAGAVVLQNIVKTGVYAGVPAKELHQ